MIGYTDAPQQWVRTNGMARRAGLDLSDAVVQGWLKRSELAEMIAGCQTCRTPAACETELRGCVTAELPQFCAIRAEIQALAPEGYAG